jgi:hypothetical protein
MAHTKTTAKPAGKDGRTDTNSLKIWLASAKGEAALKRARYSAEKVASSFEATMRLPREILFTPFTR